MTTHYELTVTSDPDSDTQPEVASLNHPAVATVQGIDTGRVRVTLHNGADVAGFEAALENDVDVKRYAAKQYRKLYVDDMLATDSETIALADRVYAAADDEDGFVAAGDMLRLFPGRPELHTITSLRRALALAGCVETSDAEE